MSTIRLTILIDYCGEIVEIVPFLFDIIQETHKDISYY